MAVDPVLLGDVQGCFKVRPLSNLKCWEKESFPATSWDGQGSLLCGPMPFHRADSLCSLPVAGSVSYVFWLFLLSSVSHVPLLVCLIC